MSDPMIHPNAAQVSFVGLVLLIVLVVLIRAPSDAPRPINAGGGQATGATAGVEGMDGNSAQLLPGQQAPGGTIALTPTESGEPPLASGCFRSESSRDEVRAVMGAPDSVVFGAWEYGRSWVTFGYGVVLDFSNVDGSLRLCE